jgi:hypothetical protein
VACSGAYGARSSFFGDINVSYFWSSTQALDAIGAFARSFWTGWDDDWAKMSMQPKVRPIRAVLAPSCANGGTCVVGDTGPGGGIVFYVHDDADDLFTSTGSDCGSNCRYLEMAPNDFAGDHLWATAVNTCYVDADPNPTTNTGASCQTGSVYRESDIPDQEASRTLSLAIGMGMTNSNLLFDRLTTAGGSIITDYAAGMAVDYSNNGKSDWHLPSRDEMNELCKYARQQATGDSTVPCDNSGSLRAGFQAWYYWTSSELIASGAPAGVEFGLHDGSAGESYASKAFANKARAIRAFG